MVRPIVEVAVNAPLLRNFHYEVPDELAQKVELGHRVLIPFGPRTITGVCVGFPSESEVPKLKPIRELLHPECRFDAHLLELTRWIATYYHVSWGEVLEAALPPPIRSRQREAVVAWIERARPAPELREGAQRMLKKAPSMAAALTFLATKDAPVPCAEVMRQGPCGRDAVTRVVRDGWAVETRAPRPAVAGGAGAPEAPPLPSDGKPLVLHPDQEKALTSISAAITSDAFRCILIQGVTGSGKTEVYLRALRQVLDAGKRGMVLVPEISLTPQTVLRFQQGLGVDSVSVLHSMLTVVERRRQWKAIQEGRAKLVIGARSSVFAPIQDLGLIVVDEEHDGSYKQESSPRYNARDVAVVRARMLGIPVLLGSATPTLESSWNASCGKYELVRLSRRATSHDLPTVQTVALGKEFYRPSGSGLITDTLDYRIRKTLRAKEQILLFLNRRGFSTYLHCLRCGFVLKCEDCDIALTFHRRDDSARCHYCGHNRGFPRECPDCQMPGLRRSGVGTERIATVLKERYPEASVLQLDRDTVTNYQVLREGLEQFALGKYNLLVGTQMIAKGHDFPNVTLVGIINADTGLHFPDFRAVERTFQLVTQVAGRAGRGERPGHVVVQTFCPEHYAIDYAARGEVDAFIQKELATRQPLGYPPYGRLVKIQLQSPDLEALKQEAERIAGLLRTAASGASERCRILGPAPSPVARIQGKHRYQILLKSKTHASLTHVLQALQGENSRGKRGVERQVDVDPQSML